MTQLTRSKLPPRAPAPSPTPGSSPGQALRRFAGAGDRVCGSNGTHAAVDRRRVIGLLGGSFNPAHAGHRQISLMALKRLRLDEVWWLVSPQNPLKPTDGMAPFGERLAGARTLASHPRIRVTGIEADLKTTYTAETLARLTRRHPDLRFIWLMGADNLVQIHEWRDWQQIFHTVAVAVFARPSYCLRALAGMAAHRFARNRVAESRSGTVRQRRPPVWVFLVGPLSPLSATAIRARRRSPRSDRPPTSQRTAGTVATTRG